MSRRVGHFSGTRIVQLFLALDTVVYAKPLLLKRV
jgi:hypothetical protein